MSKREAKSGTGSGHVPHVGAKGDGAPRPHPPVLPAAASSRASASSGGTKRKQWVPPADCTPLPPQSAAGKGAFVGRGGQHDGAWRAAWERQVGGGSQQTNRVPRPGGSRCVSIRFCWAPAAQVKGGRIWLPPPQTSPRGQGPSLSSISSGEPGSPQGHTSQQAAELGTTTIRKHRERHPDFAQVAPCPHPCPAPVHSPYPTPTAAPIPPWLSTYPSWVGARDESQHRKTEGREGRETPELAPLVANLSSISSNPYAPE